MTAEELSARLPGYEVRAVLGSGGMGTVYHAQHLKLDRPVAIKVLRPEGTDNPELSERFEREARVLASLDHPNIVRLHDFGQVAGLFYIVMEFVEGANLRELLSQGRLSTRDVLGFAPQLCDALQAAHDKGVVHRDIKPENVLIDLDGRARIADFGLARLIGHASDPIGLTGTGQVLGTPHYMAPEQVAVNGSVDHRADLYSLGVLMYEMLTGELPIGRFGPPSSKAPESAALDAPVLRALENEPDARFQAAREFKQALAEEPIASASEVKSGSSRTAVTPSSEPTRKWDQRSPFSRAMRAWARFILVVVSLPMPWFAVDNWQAGFLRDRSLGFGGAIVANGFEGTLLGIPIWVVALLPLYSAVLYTLVQKSGGTARRAPGLLEGAGWAYCLGALLFLASEPGASSQFGIYFAMIVFGAGVLDAFGPGWARAQAARHKARPRSGRRRRVLRKPGAALSGDERAVKSQRGL
ncbi:MAG: serine/threonine-protein kinase [Planctomycetota bacterium]|nr:serine/threonine-protein kinase [Planctomycetota bacterium]